VNRVARTGLILALLAWTAGATVLLCFRPDISIALNNWIFQRETKQGHTFLARDNGPEGFIAFGNETYIFCTRPCTVEELGTGDNHGVIMCDSQWEGRKHLCSARLWPGRHYIVQAKGLGRAGCCTSDRRAADQSSPGEPQKEFLE
jgi:hypothetical protein